MRAEALRAYNSPSNTSTAKALYSFSRAKRFDRPNRGLYTFSRRIYPAKVLTDLLRGPSPEVQEGDLHRLREEVRLQQGSREQPESFQLREALNLRNEQEEKYRQDFWCIQREDEGDWRDRHQRPQQARPRPVQDRQEVQRLQVLHEGQDAEPM